MAVTQLDVEHLFTMTLQVGDTRSGVIRQGPKGTRVVAAVESGTFEGPRLRGTVVPPGGDWVHVAPNRTLHLDVRVLLVTDDDEAILMSYQGIGLPGEGGSASLRTAPTFETGAERYAWLNDVQAVGIGETTPGTVTYEVYALV